MKKILIVAICLLVCGCENKTNPKQSEYNKIIEELSSRAIVEKELPFTLKVEIYDLEVEYMYNLIIEKATSEIKSIKSLVIHDIKTDSVFPSVGIFDDPVELSSAKKGIVLVGYLPKQDYDNIKFKVYIEYTYNNQEYKKYVLISTKIDK